MWPAWVVPSIAFVLFLVYGAIVLSAYFKDRVYIPENERWVYQNVETTRIYVLGPGYALPLPGVELFAKVNVARVTRQLKPHQIVIGRLIALVQLSVDILYGRPAENGILLTRQADDLSTVDNKLIKRAVLSVEGFGKEKKNEEGEMVRNEEALILNEVEQQSDQFWTVYSVKEMWSGNQELPIGKQPLVPDFTKLSPDKCKQLAQAKLYPRRAKTRSQLLDRGTDCLQVLINNALPEGINVIVRTGDIVVRDETSIQALGSPDRLEAVEPLIARGIPAAAAIVAGTDQYGQALTGTAIPEAAQHVEGGMRNWGRG